MKNFSELSEQEVLALAITLEEEDTRIYEAFAHRLQGTHPQTAKVFAGMAQEEDGHRHRLLEQYQRQFGPHIALIRRQDVKGFLQRKAIWLQHSLSAEKALKEAETMEAESLLFYARAQERTTDAGLRQLLGDLASVERQHEVRLDDLEQAHATPAIRSSEAQNTKRLFVMQVVQPGLAGLMDGSVSTLAPLFAAALATHNSWQSFLVGLAAAIGGGISMGFAEALSDDGSLTGRGKPLLRGGVCGLMTAVGGLGHTLPFLIDHFTMAMTLAILVVLAELFAIAWVRNRYMGTRLSAAMLQVVLGGLLVFVAGVLIGGA